MSERLTRAYEDFKSMTMHEQANAIETHGGPLELIDFLDWLKSRVHHEDRLKWTKLTMLDYLEYVAESGGYIDDLAEEKYRGEA